MEISSPPNDPQLDNPLLKNEEVPYESSRFLKPPRFSRKQVWILTGVLLLAVIGLSARIISSKFIKPSAPVVDILSSPTPPPSVLAFGTTYTDSMYDFSFRHPDLDTQCCAIGFSGNKKALIVLGDKATVRDGTDASFDGMAITVASLSSQTFSDFLNSEKELLNREMKRAGFTANTTSQRDALIDGQGGVLLKGYSSHGVEFVYVPFPDNKRVLVLAKTDQTPRSFDDTFDQILSTFKFPQNN